MFTVTYTKDMIKVSELVSQTSCSVLACLPIRSVPTKKHKNNIISVVQTSCLADPQWEPSRSRKDSVKFGLSLKIMTLNTLLVGRFALNGGL